MAGGRTEMVSDSARKLGGGGGRLDASVWAWLSVERFSFDSFASRWVLGGMDRSGSSVRC
jgi:hypothetical protein